MTDALEHNSLQQTANRVLRYQVALSVLLVVGILVVPVISGVVSSLFEGATPGVRGAAEKTLAQPGDLAVLPSAAQLLKALAGLFGAGLGIAGTLLSKRSVSRSSRVLRDTPDYAMLPIYMGLVNKLLIVAGGMAMGLVVFGLSPIYVVSGYLVTQIALVGAQFGLKTGASTK